MTEAGQIILGVCLLLGAFILTRKVNAWRMKKALISVIRDLELRAAFDLSSAIELPYARVSLFRFGTRDFRPKAIQYLVSQNIVGVTQEGKYYLKDRSVVSLISENQF
ncbi:MAG: hypothetical protein JRI79_08215 [Deltaproteobacteria bacterium]|nr:hypothetical protein [Deltaproteobacteria bacterium]MBW1919965.1 hypothetical protein [Deltaproteobacteria bacterium]MBW1934623.1 hypothetical protein [Deltaproteobacteria bacterium]MBW1977938.1 hypothetical protein [Deltaproteobacteria bacterium]MBW2045950.1 hypothetical protein [Deltaproteobacteria bacterium]